MKSLNFIVLFILSLVICNFEGLSQEGVNPFSYGLHIGPTFSGFTHYREVFTQKKSGVSLGIFAEYSLTPLIGVSLETNYLMQGATNVSPYLIYPESSISYANGSITKVSSDITLHSFQVPVMINIRPIIEGNIIPKISLGYTFDYIIKAWSKDMIFLSGPTYVPLSDRSFEDVTSSFEKWNCGPVFCTAIEFKTSKLNYSIEARYQLGLRDINGLAGLNMLNHQFDFSVNTFTIYFVISMKKVSITQ